MITSPLVGKMSEGVDAGRYRGARTVIPTGIPESRAPRTRAQGLPCPVGGRLGFSASRPPGPGFPRRLQTPVLGLSEILNRSTVSVDELPHFTLHHCTLGLLQGSGTPFQPLFQQPHPGRSHSDRS